MSIGFNDRACVGSMLTQESALLGRKGAHRAIKSSEPIEPYGQPVVDPTTAPRTGQLVHFRGMLSHLSLGG